MGNKGSFNPLPKYEQAYQQLTLSDAADLKSKFRDLRFDFISKGIVWSFVILLMCLLSENAETISLDAFCRVISSQPAHIFQLGASVEEMVNMAAVAVVDAQEKHKRLRDMVIKK